MHERRLRVVLVAERSSLLECAGQWGYAHRVACQLAESGHIVDIVARRDAPTVPGTMSIAPGVGVFYIDAGPPRPMDDAELLRWMPAFARQTQRSVQGEPPCDVIYALSFLSGWVGLALRPVLHAPLVTHFLNGRQGDGVAQEHGFAATREVIERTLALRSDRLLATCPQQRDDLLQRYGVAPERIAVVPAALVDELAHAGGAQAEPGFIPASVVRELERVFASLQRVPGAERRRGPRDVVPSPAAHDGHLTAD